MKRRRIVDSIGVALTAVLLAASSAHASTRGLELVAEVSPGPVQTRVTVRLRNEGPHEAAFENGAVGGPGSLDDRAASVLGTPPTVVPELLVEVPTAWAGRKMAFRAPAFGGPTLHSMQAHVVRIPPGGELSYASFEVPNDLVAGGEGRLRLELPDQILDTEVQFAGTATATSSGSP